MATKPRKKGEGSLILRGRIYWARWRIGGKQYRRSTGQTSKAKAEEVLRDYIAPFRLGSELRTLEAISARVEGVKAEVRKHTESLPTLAVSKAWDAYCASPDRPDTGAATMGMYASQFARFARWLESTHSEVLECRHVTRQITAEFATHLGAELSANSYNKYMVLLKRVWSVLSDDIKADENPWLKIRMKTDTPHSRRELTVDELTAVFTSVDGELRTLFAIGIYTGLRLGDAVSLAWSNVDLVRELISVVPSKTKKSRKPVVVPIHPALMAILSEIPTKARRGAIMPELAALYISDDTTLSDKVQEAFQRCGIETTSKASDDSRAAVDVGFHSLRHTFVSLSANAGAPLAFVQAIVGHSNPAMTRHYYHESNDALKLVVAGLPDVTGGNVPAETPKPAVDLDSLTEEELTELAERVKEKRKALKTT